MATTSRPRVKKKATKKKANKKVEKTESVEKKSYMDLEDLRYIENYNKDIQIAKSNMAVEEQFLKNLILEQKLFDHRIAQQRSQVQLKSDVFEARKLKYNNYRDMIKNKYGVKENEVFSYDPETGEIVK